MSALQRAGVARLIARAADIGVSVPEEVHAIATGSVCQAGSLGALLWVKAHPDDDPGDPVGCCWGEANDGPEGCTCWVPVYDIAQAPPRPPTDPDDLAAQPVMCGDCAYRKDSPERATPHEEEVLLELPDSGRPFWCHEGMRRPVSWVHPDGREVPGDPANWTPPVVGSIPYRADGSPGLLCHGWATRAARARQRASA